MGVGHWVNQAAGELDRAMVSTTSSWPSSWPSSWRQSDLSDPSARFAGDRRTRKERYLLLEDHDGRCTREGLGTSP